MDLAAFLLARIAEDVAEAERLEERFARGYCAPGGSWTEQDWEFVGDFRPSRVLAECEAKRRIIDWAFANAEQIDGEWGDGCLEADMRAGRCDDYGARAVEEVLSKLALPYADHPDYREAWRP